MAEVPPAFRTVSSNFRLTKRRAFHPGDHRPTFPSGDRHYLVKEKGRKYRMGAPITTHGKGFHVTHVYQYFTPLVVIRLAQLRDQGQLAGDRDRAIVHVSNVVVAGPVTQNLDIVQQRPMLVRRVETWQIEAEKVVVSRPADSDQSLENPCRFFIPGYAVGLNGAKFTPGVHFGFFNIATFGSESHGETDNLIAFLIGKMTVIRYVAFNRYYAHESSPHTLTFGIEKRLGNQFGAVFLSQDLDFKNAPGLDQCAGNKSQRH